MTVEYKSQKLMILDEPNKHQHVYTTEAIQDALTRNEPKQIIIIRKDLNMRRGKQIAQGAHASLKAILDSGKIIRTHPQEDDQAFILDITPHFHPALHQWLTGRFTKICVYVNSEQELLDIYKQAEDAGLVCSLIQDAGLTEFGGVSTYTVVAIGPAFPEEVDPITKHLPLL